ncbi:hypothetical protein [Pseudophaeobacter profundi]|uniref:hypothetical protein n=1 Tax=Pseudophaeobacter profundi TaxID=3034152 RepID=UPI00242B322F|nr:hypothetical protein [Pseudophaeobacter profundi]
MIGDMVFLQILIQDMLRVFRRLEYVELGLFMRIVLENCLHQGPLQRDDPGLFKLLGAKTKKTFNRTLEVLIEKGVVRDENGAIMAPLAEKSISHFQNRSGTAKRAVASRKDRQQHSSEMDASPPEFAPPALESSRFEAASQIGQHETREKGDANQQLPFDRLLTELQSHALDGGHPNLAEGLIEEGAQRQVEAWCTLGLPHSKIVATIVKTMQKKGPRRISSWSYFDQPLQESAGSFLWDQRHLTAPQA